MRKQNFAEQMSRKTNWAPGRGLNSRGWDRTPAKARKPSRSRLAEIELEMYGMRYVEERVFYDRIGVALPTPRMPKP